MAFSITDAKENLHQWRVALLQRLLLVVLVVGAPVLGYAAFTAGSDFALVEPMIFAGLLALWAARSLPHQIRVMLLVALVLFVGGYIVSRYGVVSGGRLYLSAGVLLAGILGGTLAGVLSFICASLILLLTGYLALSGQLQLEPEAMELSALGSWWVWYYLSFAAYTITSLASVLFLLNRLQALLLTLEDNHFQREEALNAELASKQKYQLLAENVTDVIWTTDLNFRLTYISPSVEKMRGYTAEEAMNIGFSVLAAREEIDRWAEILSSELADEVAGRPVSETRRLDTQLRHKDGHLVDVELLVSFLRDPEGKPVGLLGISRDITERKQLEVAMNSVLRGTQQNRRGGFFDSL
ncbi:MAG: PAS domain S-box protein, partial [Pseudomonadales bacterium]|nr:PAS domain S-box protein [Pseudomonadales bacterium]